MRNELGCLRLFGEKAACGECHSGINFTDESFHNVGVGRDAGRARVTAQAGDAGAFKTPTLRELTRTGPYMHDGSQATLAEVIEYYDKGCHPHPNLDSRIRKLGLTPEEKADLLAFLGSSPSTRQASRTSPAPSTRA